MFRNTNIKETPMRAVIRSLLAVLLCALAFQAHNLFATANTSRVATISYVATNVSTGAYVTLISSTAISTSFVEFCDTSAKIMKLAKGAAGSEVDIATSNVSGCIQLNYYIPAGTRLSVESATQAATTGYGTVSLLP